ncbi:putative nuclease HARBI1 [Juglans regia]|uniref:Nuclease HARBI1 n=1 Tax=Juglans regia TaxID=51240 RepID=A0A6P9ETW7_JUGRE|nr:putative nuclease HARBI1 [Juglans regia]
MDGTMIPAVVPAELHEAYRNRLGRVAQNVLAIVDFDMKFIFVYTGWEGSAHDARVFHHAASDPEARFPWPPEGQYYLVDSAYPCTMGLLPPYPRERYHRSDRHNDRGFHGYKDYFNYHHSTVRNIVERTFGVIKERFHILSNMPPYSVGRQGLIITACCTLHNYIRTVTPDDWIFQTWSTMRLPVIEPAVGDGGSSPSHMDLSTEAQNNMSAIRDDIAIAMWEARGGH